MKKIILLSLLLLGIQVKNIAQKRVDADPIIKKGLEDRNKFLWDRGSSFMQQVTLYNDIDLSSYELISANISFTEKDQAQKLVIAPFRFINNVKKFKSLANTKINLALKDQVTTFGVGFGGDNAAPFSKRADRILNEIFAGTIPPAGVPGRTPDSFEQHLLDILSNTSCKCFSKEQVDSLEKLYHKKKLDVVFEQYKKTELATSYKLLDSLLLLYDKRIAENVFKWTIGYNVQVFPNLFSKGTVNNFDSLNYYEVNAHNYSAALTYGHNNNELVLSAGLNYIRSRATAEKGKLLVPYIGPSVTASYRLWQFIPQKRLDTMANYKKNLFVPSLNIGVGWEGKFGDKNTKYSPFYKDDVQTRIVWSPFVDILITPALQFRIALPFTRLTYPNNEKIITAGANIQYNLKLSNLSQ